MDPHVKQYLLDRVFCASNENEAKTLTEIWIQLDTEDRDITQEESTILFKNHIGYLAGYSSDAVRERIETLFECEHPIFGSIKELGPPTPQEAYVCGKECITLKQLRKALN